MDVGGGKEEGQWLYCTEFYACFSSFEYAGLWMGRRWWQVLRRGYCSRKKKKHSELPPLSELPDYVPKDPFCFKVIGASEMSDARIGTIQTGHGSIETPAFIFSHPDSTIVCGNEKQNLKRKRSEPIVCQAANLQLNPGTANIVASGGSLHEFFQRSGVVMTESGAEKVRNAFHKLLS